MKKDMSIELCRVIATVFVIILHMVGKGGILSNVVRNSPSYFVAWIMEIGAFCAVNCFALISGYLMCNKKIKGQNIINLWFHAFFYSSIINAIFFLVMPETITTTNLISSFLPIVSNQWWYMSAYFVLFFSIPFLNQGISQMSKTMYEKVLLVIIVGICIFDVIIPGNTFDLQDGYSALWLMIVYLFGAYIRKYNIKDKISAFKSLMLYVLMIALTLLSKIVIGDILGSSKYEKIFISYQSFTILFAAIFIFLFCLNIKIGEKGEKLIGFVSPLCLGIYLIHVHQLVFEILINNMLIMLVEQNVLVMTVGVIMAAILVFMICSVIEIVRLKIFKILKVKEFSAYLNNQMNHIFLLFFSK